MERDAMFRNYLVTLCVLCSLLTPLSACSGRNQSPKYDPRVTMKKRYQTWLEEHGKSYKDQDEWLLRFGIYQSNVQFIDYINAQNLSYKLSDNEFADLTNEEFKSIYLGITIQTSGHSMENQTVQLADQANLPASVDWKKQGAVTPVQNQGQCGSCWSFSTVVAIEGITKIKTGKLVSLSEQQLVDCDKGDGNRGCSGGFMETAFAYVKRVGGLTTDTNYPYNGRDGTCNKKKEANHAATISGYKKVSKSDENSLMAAVAKQPVSVAIDAAGYDFQLYSSGVFSGYCGSQLNHGVAIVGYGSDAGKKFWTVKNSWGTTWGEAGYIRIVRGSGNKNGHCGINMMASYPTK